MVVNLIRCAPKSPELITPDSSSHRVALGQQHRAHGHTFQSLSALQRLLNSSLNAVYLLLAETPCSPPSPRKRLAGGLWARARREGAVTQRERRNYGIADDIYAAGLLLAYMCFLPFCEPGSVDGPSLQVGV